MSIDDTLIDSVAFKNVGREIKVPRVADPDLLFRSVTDPDRT